MYFEPSKKQPIVFLPHKVLQNLITVCIFEKPDHAKEASHYDYNESCAICRKENTTMIKSYIY